MTKAPLDTPKFDTGERKNVAVTLNAPFITSNTGNQKVTQVLNWITGKILWDAANAGGIPFETISVSVDPGDLAVLEFQFA